MGGLLMFVHVTDGTADKFRHRPPTEGVRADTGQTVSGIPPDDLTLLAACGWHPVTPNPRPDDTPTDTHERSIENVAGTWTEVWTPRPWTQTELDARQADTNRTAIETKLAEFIDAAAVAQTQLDQTITIADLILTDPAPDFTNLTQARQQVTGLQTRQHQLAAEARTGAVIQKAHIAKTVALARYVANNLGSLDGT